MDLDAYFGHKAVAEDYKSGFVGIIGRPNVGKSTLMNRILGQKIAIMSDKPQTTRNKIQGIYSDDEMQVIFLDTPGVHKPQHKLGEYMNKAATGMVGDVDIIFYLIDATAKIGGGEEFIAAQLKKVKAPVFLIVNKIDLIQPPQVLKVIKTYSRLLDFAEVVPVSALNGENVDELLLTLKKYLPKGPQYYDPDQITDQPERAIMAEIIREKIFLNTRDEIPHSVAVAVTEYSVRENGALYIGAAIYVERESQKGIIIGKGGKMLKEIGSAARPEIENLFGNRVFLDLRVKVKKDWRNKDNLLKNFGYDKKDL